MAAAAAELNYTREKLSGQSLAYSADFHPTDKDGEVYAYSTTGIDKLGGAVVGGLVEVQETGIYQQVLAEYLDAIAENLTTDEELGENLKFDGLRRYRVVDGIAVDKSGQPIADLVREGWKKSKEAAKHDPRMWDQAERDQGDVMVVDIVDGLASGEVYVVTSMEPKRALASHPEYWTNKGYKRGMAVFHVFYKASETELWAGTYSVMQSSPTALRAIMASLGARVPEEISDNHWTRHGARFKATREKARELGKELQADHHRRTGQTGRQISVTDLVESEKDNLVDYFDALMVPLSKARHTGKSESVIADFARRLLPRADVLSPDEKRTLMHVANSPRFSVEDARVMESFIRYAVVEELRKKLDRQINGTPADQTQLVISMARGMNPALLSERFATNIEGGRVAGRSYEGCSPMGPAQKDSDAQNAFGVNVESEGSVETDEDCEYSGTFCYCCPYNSDGSKAAQLVVVTARRRSDGIAECLRAGCNATLDSKGNANKGTIYDKAMKLQASLQKTKAT